MKLSESSNAIQCSVSDWLQNLVDEEKEVRKGTERRGEINANTGF